MKSEELASLIIGSILLFGPYLWEIGDDPLGDLNKRRDVWIRGGIMGLVGLINTLLNVRDNMVQALYFFALSVNASLAIFFLLFDYTIAWILIRNKIVGLKNLSWFDYLGKVGEVDNWEPWRKLSGRARFWIRVAYFVVGVGIYVYYVVTVVY